ncbi:phosphoribosyltransferase [Weissella sagaensis]|jgi:hypoxanthine phosphoribosyltransferase|uniref:Hypoxanthine-guanine phosphoribosyltransferase n=1 Tax=Weissella sagaensis TaxID=2559928 RepID=A0ABW1RSM2_9LACO|nr:phosphoribosyltransferase family protein [Weissella sagaensis]KAA8434070.1 hypoxanthine phosphoribosyltransferase [Weissella paramesenteroides]MBU7568015.1 hypoxanthine phosphoribosyltransferase [Weissella hellenica]KAA8438160.1 hypoxanthine phosphoribosyltransferase [Weissella paramesenteroides]QDJ58314.1 hypoxanthine phosphoribosyltransferase [Weissella hellenica]QEA57306.1 hypoxanthine phosphoribosyltransferase [Weissella hellenica]
MPEMRLARTILSVDDIEKMVNRVAGELNEVLVDVERPVFIGVMKGAYMWMADLMRAMQCEVELDYIDVSSYVGDKSTGHITIQRDLKVDLKDRTVVILDEVVDSGLTLRYLKADFEARGAKKVYVAVATDKRQSESAGGITPDFIGAHVPDEFLVGYGMDYNEYYRGLPYVAVLELNN